MFKKFLVILSSILIVAGLFACGNNAEVEELKKQVAELKQQNEQKQEETVETTNSINSISKDYSFVLRDVYRRIKSKDEYISFYWPLIREDGILEEVPDGFNIYEKPDCKFDVNGNLWVYWYANIEDNSDYIYPRLSIYYKDGTEEVYGNDGPNYGCEHIYYSHENISNTKISIEEFEDKVSIYNNLIDSWNK